jgi:LAO/AO transport system kinase
LGTDIKDGNRTALAQAITLIESKRSDHQTQAQDLLQTLLPLTGKAKRIGITGVPGVGKSTLIDTLGSNLTNAGHKVAVLAVDPSSQRTGGSILGDKTRMERLSVDRSAFIRPSPASGTLGGVTRKTRETILLCEAAGFDIIIVETVGIGQSETAVAEMVDFFLVLMLMGAGDELQGIKKGVLEIADMIAVNKADGINEARASKAAAEYRGALNILTPVSPNWSPPVITISGLENSGLDHLWQEIERHHQVMKASGEFDERRQNQQVRWMWSLLEDSLMTKLRNHKDAEVAIEVAERDVRTGVVTAAGAANRLLQFL